MTKGTKKAASKKGSKLSKKESSKKKVTRKKALTPNERPTPNERTSEEAAVLIGLTDVSSVRQAYRRGKISGRVVGRQLWITLEEIRRYKRERRKPGRPLDTITGESHNKRGAQETEYQREYRREYRRKQRAGLLKSNRKAAKGRSSKRSTAKSRR